MNHTAIYNTHSNVVSIDDTEGAFDADGNSVTIDQSLVDAEITRLQTEYDAQEYARNRAKEYPPMEDYLDGVVKGDQAQIDKYIADCLAVKEKYPK